MKIAQKISLSFAVIFLLVFTLGATAVLSLRQIYKGVYESLRNDVPAIHESAFLGIQLASLQKEFKQALVSNDPSQWEGYLESSAQTQKIIEGFSNYIVQPAEQDILDRIRKSYQEIQRLAETAQSERRGWQEKHRQFLDKRETILDQISLLMQPMQERLKQEKDLFLVQSHYLPVLTHLSDYRKRIRDYSAALDQSMMGAVTEQAGPLSRAESRIRKIESLLQNYVLLPDEQSRYELLKGEVESFIALGDDVLERYRVSLETLQRMGQVERQIQESLVQWVEQERHQVARKTGLGVTFIEDIPATRVASLLGIYASNSQTVLERYLLTANQDDRKEYEQLTLGTRKSLDEYGKFVSNRETGGREQVILKQLEEINVSLTEQNRQILLFYEEQRKLAGELQELSNDFEKEADGFLSRQAEKIAEKRDIDPVREKFLPRMELTISLLAAVSESIGDLNRYPLTRDTKAKETYDAKLLEILQGLDRLKGMLSEEQENESGELGRLFGQIRVVANDLIEASDHFWSRRQDKEAVVSSHQKSLREVLEEEKEKNSAALSQLEKKVALVNGVIIGIVFLILVGGIAVIVYTTQSITKPIQELSQGAKVIGGGQLGYRIPLQTGDELEDLAKEFNKMTHELQGLYTDLELKVEQRTRELAKVNTALAESNKELDDFTYIVSHDLKEPLRGIDAFSRFLLQDYAPKLDPKAKEYLESITGASKRMTQLIENLLDLSRISRQRNPYEETDFNKILEEVRKNLEYALTEKKVDLKVDFLPILTCDQVRIQQVFHNLISNAVKYNHNEKPVVEVGCVQKGPFCEFYVRDNGKGIKKEYFEKVFKLFQRLPGSEKVEGTGAGLMIVKKIIETHGGKIWLESSEGEGTTFFFTLPAQAARSVHA